MAQHAAAASAAATARPRHRPTTGFTLITPNVVQVADFEACTRLRQAEFETKMRGRTRGRSRHPRSPESRAGLLDRRPLPTYAYRSHGDSVDGPLTERQRDGRRRRDRKALPGPGVLASVERVAALVADRQGRSPPSRRCAELANRRCRSRSWLRTALVAPRVRSQLRCGPCRCALTRVVGLVGRCAGVGVRSCACGLPASLRWRVDSAALETVG